MAELMLTDVDDAVLHHLQELAVRHGARPTRRLRQFWRNL